METTDLATSMTDRTEQLPEFWPDLPRPEPVRAVWLPWPIAVLLAPLLWIMPRRMGPHFAAVRWPGVIVGHLFWTIYGIGCIAMTVYGNDYGWVAYLAGRTPGHGAGLAWYASNLSETFRSPLALLAWGLSNAVTSIESFGLGVGVFVGVEIGVAVIASLLMAYAAAGENSRRLFARCVKLTFWATGSLVVLGLALQAVELFALGEAGKAALRQTAVSLYVAWFVWIWIRSGLRYAGPAIGPGWERRQARCEQCGYILAGLTAADRCPECGRPVLESLPENRRLPRFASVHGVLAAVPAFFTTLAAAMLARGFFKHMAFHEGHAPARRFAILVCGLCGPLAFIYTALIGTHVRGALLGGSRLEWLALLTTTWVGTTVAFICIIGLTSLLTSLVGMEILRPKATVVCYLAAWFIPISLSPLLLPLAAGALSKIASSSFCRHLGLSHGLRAEEIYLGALLCPLLLAVVPLLELPRALRQTRLANR